MSFSYWKWKLHADIPHETLTFLEDSKNALSPRMFNIFLCFFVFHIHTELISSQYMPGSRTSQSREKGLRLRRKTHVPQLFPPRRPSVPVYTEIHGHRESPSHQRFYQRRTGSGKTFLPLLFYHTAPRMHGSFPEKARRIPMKGPQPRQPPATRLFFPPPCPRVFSGIP